MSSEGEKRTGPTIDDYKGKTFVAFLDMCGFKEMMKNDIEDAGEKLGFFFDTIFDITGFNNSLKKIHAQEHDIAIIAISDCAIIFPLIPPDAFNPLDLNPGLGSLLSYIEWVNEKLLKKGILTTTSIAYGDFEYQNRIQIKNLRKNMFIGEPYLKAYLDSENKNPKLRPGECRVLRKTLPNEDFFKVVKDHYPNSIIHKLKKRGNKYLYFYWIDEPSKIGKFKREYEKIQDRLYKDTINLYRGYVKT